MKNIDGVIMTTRESCLILNVFMRELQALGNIYTYRMQAVLKKKRKSYIHYLNRNLGKR